MDYPQMFVKMTWLISVKAFIGLSHEGGRQTAHIVKSTGFMKSTTRRLTTEKKHYLV